jgi:hypothetical protein
MGLSVTPISERLVSTSGWDLDYDRLSQGLPQGRGLRPARYVNRR